MTNVPCPYEAAVAAEARTGEWSAENDAHRRECLSCAELSLVVAALEIDARELAEIDEPLPDPSAVWLRATLANRERDYQRATRAIVWIQRAAVTLALGLGVFFAPGLLGGVVDAVRTLDISMPTAQLPRTLGSPILVLAASLVVLGILALWELTAVRDA